MSNTSYITLSQLQALIGNAIEDAMPASLWVSAEIAEMKVNYSGHCYLELVEKESSSSEAQTKAQIRGVIWKSAFARLVARFEAECGRHLEAGMKILVRASVTYHPLYGLSLQIIDIDPSYTLGEAERQKRLTIAQLQADGVWDMNHYLSVAEVVQRIAIVSSASAAGYQDFCREVERSPYRFHTELFEAVMQGTACEESVVNALQRIVSRESEFDAVVIIRGGGSTGDLSWFNSYAIASIVAQFPLPVITGIGHDKDMSVTDMVAHTALKTPTAVATWLHERALSFDARLEESSLSLISIADSSLHSARLRLGELSARLGASAHGLVVRAITRLENIDKQLHTEIYRTFDLAQQRIDAFARLAESLSPRRLLQLGLAVAKEEGRTVHSVDDTAIGRTITLTVADGEIDAQVKQIRKNKE